jgi:hypothetical protein
MTSKHDFFMPCWVGTFSENLPKRARQLSSSPIYGRNSVLAFFASEGVEFTFVDAEGFPDFHTADKKALFVQHKVLQQSADGHSYLQMLHPNCNVGRDKWIFFRVPMYPSPDLTHDRMVDVHITELAIDEFRRTKQLPQIPKHRKQTYFNDDAYTSKRNWRGRELLTFDLMKPGPLIDTAVGLLTEAFAEENEDVQDPDLASAIQLVAFNNYINQYFLTQLIFGYHGQFYTNEDLDYIAAHTLNVGCHVESETASAPAFMHLVVMRESQHLSNQYSIINANFSEHIRKIVGSLLWNEQSDYAAQFQHVDESGNAFFLASKLCMFTEETDSECQSSGLIRKLICRVEEQVRQNGDSAPLVLFAFEDCIRSEMIFEPVQIDEVDEGDKRPLPVTTIRIDNLMV